MYVRNHLYLCIYSEWWIMNCMKRKKKPIAPLWTFTVSEQHWIHFIHFCQILLSPSVSCLSLPPTFLFDCHFILRFFLNEIMPRTKEQKDEEKKINCFVNCFKKNRCQLLCFHYEWNCCFGFVWLPFTNFGDFLTIVFILFCFVLMFFFSLGLKWKRDQIVCLYQTIIHFQARESCNWNKTMFMTVNIKKKYIPLF